MTGRIIHGDATPEAWADADEWVAVEGVPVAEVPPLGTPAALAYVELVKAKECYSASKEWFRMAESHLRTAAQLLETKNA